MKTLLFTLIAFPLLAIQALALDQSHSTWDEIVSKRVKGDSFDYAGLKKDREPLDGYLGDLAKVKSSEYGKWSESEKLAFLINLYNAATVRLIVDHYPVKSIRDIGGKEGPWKEPVVSVFGKKVTLDHVEHEMIRAKFAEPRIHFAVNCASVGCPPLRNEAFTGAKLERQLSDQTKDFLTDRDVNRLKGKTLTLSPLFDWFKGDFAKSAGSVEKYVAPYFPESERKRILAGVTLKFGEYDWSLNGR